MQILSSMKKVFFILLLLIFNLAKGQEQLSNIIVNVKSDSVMCLLNSKLDTSYHGVDSLITRQLISDSLQNELSNYIEIVKANYIISGDTLNVIQYQNKSQNALGYEQFWIISKQKSLCLKLEDLSPQLQESIYMFGLKIIENIKKGYYYEN